MAWNGYTRVEVRRGHLSDITWHAIDKNGTPLYVLWLLIKLTILSLITVSFCFEKKLFSGQHV